MKTYADYRWWRLKKKIPNIDEIINELNRNTTFPERASMIIILAQKLKVRPEDLISVQKMVYKEGANNKRIPRDMEQQMEEDENV